MFVFLLYLQLYNLHLQYTYREGWETKDGKKIYYIFMDETMQFLSGTCCMEIISNLKKKSLIPSIDVYIVTAYEDLSSHNHILSFGVKKIITKPLSYSKLKQTLEWFIIELIK